MGDRLVRYGSIMWRNNGRAVGMSGVGERAIAEVAAVGASPMQVLYWEAP
jgi:hypothetical protein